MERESNIPFECTEASAESCKFLVFPFSSAGCSGDIGCIVGEDEAELLTVKFPLGG